MNQEREAVARLQAYADKITRRAEILRGFADQQADAGYQATADSDADSEERLGADLRWALNALRSGGEGWRPISEAPRDGTHIILAFGQDHSCEGWFLDDDNEPRPWAFIDIGDSNMVFINRSRDGEYGPSHWQPMPYREPRNRPSPSTQGEG